MCSVKENVWKPLAIAACTISSRVFFAWPQNWPEWLWWENGILVDVMANSGGVPSVFERSRVISLGNDKPLSEMT